MANARVHGVERDRTPTKKSVRSHTALHVSCTHKQTERGTKYNRAQLVVRSYTFVVSEVGWVWSCVAVVVVVVDDVSCPKNCAIVCFICTSLPLNCSAK